jgi:hypothetical protein
LDLWSHSSLCFIPLAWPPMTAVLYVSAISTLALSCSPGSSGSNQIVASLSSSNAPSSPPAYRRSQISCYPEGQIVKMPCLQTTKLIKRQCIGRNRHTIPKLDARPFFVLKIILSEETPNGTGTDVIAVLFEVDDREHQDQKDRPLKTEGGDDADFSPWRSGRQHDRFYDPR